MAPTQAEEMLSAASGHDRHLIGDIKLHNKASSSQDSDSTDMARSPEVITALLRTSSDGSSSNSIQTPSDDDYDMATTSSPSQAADTSQHAILQRLAKTSTMPIEVDSGHQPEALKKAKSFSESPKLRRRRSIPIKLEKVDTEGRYRLTALDSELRELLKNRLQTDSEFRSSKQRTKFSDLVFTQQFTAFDRANPDNAVSPFHGFFTLFWLGTALLIIKVSAENWRTFGSIFGRNEVLINMFHKDVIVLGLTDGVMCGATSMGLALQRAVLRGWVRWNGAGWILQHIWQTFYIAFFVWWTRHRSWSWTHTVFTVLHCITMLMKQHSYAFTNGYCKFASIGVHETSHIQQDQADWELVSELYKRKKILERKLKQLELLEPVKSPSSVTPAAGEVDTAIQDNAASSARRRRFSVANTDAGFLREDTPIGGVAAAIEAGAELDMEQIHAYDKIIKWEIDELSTELRGKSRDGSNSYPNNLTLSNWAEWTVLPTLVYELEYSRQERINWYYVLEKTVATFGTIGVMIVISQAFIYPVVMYTVKMKEDGWTLSQRLHEFPWVLSDLLFPFMMEYMLSWYVIWECVLNLLAELTCFADRLFYADWWNTVSWDQFAKDWNRPVHAFLLRHVYHSSISALRISRGTATLITFFLSACVHELLMWCIFKKLRGYLLVMQMMQLPLVMISRTRLLKGRAILGNVVFWLGIFTGPSFLCSLYLIL